MVILDTSIWIEFLKQNDPYFDQVSDLLDKNDILGLSFIFGELFQGAKNARERSIIAEFWDAIPKISEEELFIRAGEESGKSRWINKGIGLIDAAILIAAKESASFLWTLDKKLLKILSREERYSP